MQFRISSSWACHKYVYDFLPKACISKSDDLTLEQTQWNIYFGIFEYMRWFRATSLNTISKVTSSTNAKWSTFIFCHFLTSLITSSCLSLLAFFILIREIFVRELNVPQLNTLATNINRKKKVEQSILHCSHFEMGCGKHFFFFAFWLHISAVKIIKVQCDDAIRSAQQ